MLGTSTRLHVHFSSPYIHSSIHFLLPFYPFQGYGEAEAYISCHWASCRIHPEWDTNPSLGHTETKNHEPSHSLFHNVETAMNLQCRFLGCRKKLEYLVKPTWTEEPSRDSNLDQRLKFKFRDLLPNSIYS